MSTIMDTPHPSPAEMLRAEYGHVWDIWRELLPGGRHGDWLAEMLPSAGESRHLRAATVEALERLLRDAGT